MVIVFKGGYSRTLAPTSEAQKSKVKIRGWSVDHTGCSVALTYKQRRRTCLAGGVPCFETNKILPGNAYRKRVVTKNNLLSLSSYRIRLCNSFTFLATSGWMNPEQVLPAREQYPLTMDMDISVVAMFSNPRGYQPHRKVFQQRPPIHKKAQPL